MAGTDLNLAEQVQGTLAVDNGGTGATSLTGLVVGNGASAFTAVTAPSGAVVGTTDTQTETNKTLSDTYMGEVFDAHKTQRDTTLLASNDFAALDTLEIAAGSSLEIPATSSLEILRYVTPSSVDTLSGKTLVNPLVNNVIYDSNGAPSLGITANTNAVNYLQVGNSPSGTSVVINVQSLTDPTVNLSLQPKGTSGQVVLKDGSSNWILACSSVSNAVNYINPSAAASGSSPSIYPAGETNLDLLLGAAGTGLQKGVTAFGTGVLESVQFITLTSTFALTNATGAQKLFNSPTNGAVTLAANTTYFFECMCSITGLSSSTHNVGFGFGGTATITRQAWWSECQGSAALATATSPLVTYNTAASTALIAAGTNTTFFGAFRGKLVIGTGGTLIPQINQVTAATAATVGNDSYFRIWADGSNTVQSQGNWS